MKYKVGDKVRLRSDLKVGNYGTCYCCDSMTDHAGEVVTIRELHKIISNRFYIKEDLRGCHSSWDWSFEMLDGLAEEAAPEPQHKYKVGDKVRVRKDLVVTHYGPCACWASASMVAMGGRIVTISKLVADEDLYNIEEGPGLGYNWSEEMFEGLADAAPEPELDTDWSWEDLF